MTDEAGRLSINDLPLHDQLLHGIGRVAQAQVEVEVQVEIILCHLYTALALPSVAAAHLGPRRNSIDQLAQDCRLMLANSPLQNDYTSAGDDALRASIEADSFATGGA